MFGALRWWNGDVSVFDNLVLYVSIAVSIAGAVVNAQAARRVKPEDPGRATNFTLTSTLALFYVGVYVASAFTDADPFNIPSFARGLGLVALWVVWFRPARRALLGKH
jgi:hypothetical protein